MRYYAWFERERLRAVIYHIVRNCPHHFCCLGKLTSPEITRPCRLSFFGKIGGLKGGLVKFHQVAYLSWKSQSLDGRVGHRPPRFCISCKISANSFDPCFQTLDSNLKFAN